MKVVRLLFVVASAFAAGLLAGLACPGPAFPDPHHGRTLDPAVLSDPPDGAKSPHRPTASHD